MKFWQTELLSPTSKLLSKSQVELITLTNLKQEMQLAIPLTQIPSQSWQL